MVGYFAFEISSLSQPLYDFERKHFKRRIMFRDEHPVFEVFENIGAVLFFFPDFFFRPLQERMDMEKKEEKYWLKKLFLIFKMD